MRLVLAGVAAMSAFAFAAPTASAALPDVGATAASTASTATGAATSATSAATGAAATAGSAAASSAASSASSTRGAVERQATKTVAPIKQVAAGAEQAAVEGAASKARPPAPPAPAAIAPPPVEVPRSPVEVLPTSYVGRDVGRHRDTIAHTVDGLRGVRPVDDALTLLGDTVREIAPVGELLTPVVPLLGAGGPLAALPDLVAVVSRPEVVPALDPTGAPPAGGVLGTNAGPGGAPVGATPGLGAPSQTFQAASARPPAAEVGGRPVSPIPWTAPAPVAGGAAAVFSGAVFVPFLGLLVLAALMVPRLMRRLDELPAFVRPEPFLCALERPG